MRKTLFITVFLGLIFNSYAQSNLADFIQTKGDSLLKAEKWPGLFVGVFDGSRQFFSFGYAVPDERLPFDSATVFEAGSITKTFTAFIVESILQQKRISDSSFIINYLPDSVRANKALAGITFLSLLNHTSGLPRLPDNLDLNSKAPYDNYTVNDLFSFLKRCTPKPDGKSNYSNLGMGLAGVLVERMTGESYQKLLKIHVLLPFDMQEATKEKKQKAQGYFGDHKQQFWKMNALAPAGGLQCSANDMMNYLQTLSLGGRPYQTTTIQKILMPAASVAPNVNVCRAWHTLEEKGKPTIYWHNGGTYGFSTFAAFVKDTERCVIIVVNKFNTNAVSDGLGIAIMKKMLAR